MYVGGRGGGAGGVGVAGGGDSRVVYAAVGVSPCVRLSVTRVLDPSARVCQVVVHNGVGLEDRDMTGVGRSYHDMSGDDNATKKVTVVSVNFYTNRFNTV